MARAFRLSVAIPVFDEETVVLELVRRVCDVLDRPAGGSHEIVFVDEGSTDHTFELLEPAAQKDPRIIVVSLPRNFGHQAALAAALDHVTRGAVVLMDGDLQEAPEVIPQFIDLYNQGYDVVYGQRVRSNEPWPLRLCYFLFYRMMARLSDVLLPLDSGDFGLISRRAIDHLRRMPEHHRYLRGFADGIFAFSIVPNRAAALLGAGSC
jgi:glycosyltransferase involved in cell wall biosynthesis